MRVCVQGLWHLGCVTAACVAEHFPTAAYDPDPQKLAKLKEGGPPILEAGRPRHDFPGLGVKQVRSTGGVEGEVAREQGSRGRLDTPLDEKGVGTTDSARGG